MVVVVVFQGTVAEDLCVKIGVVDVSRRLVEA